ncbi:MAG: hypothetical protein OXU20_09510, partial [Myxococcales bacterium]|nr:hypothetical protein [Myxococcales bacterium]
MEQLRRKIARMGRRARALPRLDEALLTTRRFAYARYRLRYLALRIPLRTALHAMEVLLFARAVWPEYLPYFLLLRSGGAMVNGLVWGALEALRTDVRSALRRRRVGSARALIERFLGASLWLQLSLALGLFAYLRWAPTPFSTFSILDAYAIALFLRVGLDVFARVYHAGIYARSRVYRPLWSLLLSDAVDVVLVLALLPWLGPWAFAPALLAGGACKNGLVLWFCRRTYRQTPMLAPRWRSAFRPTGLGGDQLSRVGRFAVANLGGQLDAWIVAALSATASLDRGGLALAALVHMLRPALAAGAGWSRLFYFDFKRLDHDAAGLLRHRFDRMLEQVAWGGGALLSVLIAGLGALVPGLQVPMFLLPWLAAFVIARSLFGLRQLQAFVDDLVPVLLAQSGLALLGLLCVLAFAPSAAWSLAILA